MQTVIDNADLMWDGLRLTLELSVVVIALSSLLGLLVGIGLLFGNLVMRSILRLYVDVIRGLPLLVVIFLIFYGLPALDVTVLGYHIDTNIGRFATATIAFTLFGGAHVGEIVRGAIGTVPAGQSDAAKAIGLTFWPRLLTVLLPQSLPVIIPPWVNTAAEIVKGTSLVVLVSMSDLLFETRKIAERTGDFIPLFGAAGLTYFVICFSISRAGAWLGRRFQYGVAR